MSKYSKTTWFTAIQACGSVGGEYVPPVGTTLNDKFSIVTLPVTDKIPTIGYYMMGLNYESMIVDNTLDMDSVVHEPTDTSVYRPVPFITRQVTSDLTIEEREGYYLRVVSGDNVHYYGKKLTHVDKTNKFISGESSGGETHISRFTSDPSVLNPVPNSAGLDDLFSSTLKFTGITLNASISLIPAELEEIQNSISILYPNETNPSIREIGLISGLKSIDNGVTELYNAQVCFFIKTNFLINEYIDIESVDVAVGIELGGMETHVSPSR